MRDNKVREVVTRLLTDPDFAQAVQLTPGKALARYGLADDELAALSSLDTVTSSVGRLETRVSASVFQSVLAGPDCCGCITDACLSGKKDCKCCP